MDAPWVYVLWGCAAYLLGSVSFGDLVARLAGSRIRELGTGNPGTANVFRELGPRYSAAVFALDLAKGAAATLPAFVLDLPVWAGLAGTVGVMFGHFLPVFWRFRGGTCGLARAPESGRRRNRLRRGRRRVRQEPGAVSLGRRQAVDHTVPDLPVIATSDLAYRGETLWNNKTGGCWRRSFSG